jgi:hypothetical protein
MYLPAPRTPYASEFGHLSRVVSIYSKVESILDTVNGSFFFFLPVFLRTSPRVGFLIGSESGGFSDDSWVELEQRLNVSVSLINNEYFPEGDRKYRHGCHHFPIT